MRVREESGGAPVHTFRRVVLAPRVRTAVPGYPAQSSATLSCPPSDSDGTRRWGLGSARGTVLLKAFYRKPLLIVGSRAMTGFEVECEASTTVALRYGFLLLSDFGKRSVLQDVGLVRRLGIVER